MGAAAISPDHRNNFTPMRSWRRRAVAVVLASLTFVSAAVLSGVRAVAATSWAPQTTLADPYPAPCADFGYSVALDGDRDIALVGAPTHPEATLNAGVAYVYTRSSDAWSDGATLIPSDATSAFGISVALDEEGRTAVIGANGAVYVFTRVGSAWTQEAKLTASDGASEDAFGFSVALSKDGLTALIGAPSKDQATGAAYVFVRGVTLWRQRAELSGTVPYGAFGASVALAQQGRIALAGAPSEQSNTGAAYVFSRIGATWSSGTKLTALDATRGEYFGLSIALDAQGRTSLIGAPGRNNGSGVAYVFTHPAGAWTQQAELTADDAVAHHHFGWSVVLDEGGDRILAGSPGQTWPVRKDREFGAAYIFIRAAGAWTQQAELTAADAVGDSFGWSGALDKDGQTALVGAPSPSGVCHTPAPVYVFSR